MPIKIAEQHRITCPYCIVGAGMITVDRTGDSLSFDTKKPVKCAACKSYFLVKPHLKLVGERFEQEMTPLHSMRGN